MKHLLKIAALITLSSCTTPTNKTAFNQAKIVFDKQFIPNIKEKYNIAECHYSCNEGDTIQLIGARLLSGKTLSMEEARKFYVNITNEVIQTFNQNKLTQPPLEFENTEIEIYFYNIHGNPTNGINIILSKYKSDSIQYYKQNRKTKKVSLENAESFHLAKLMLDGENYLLGGIPLLPPKQ